MSESNLGTVQETSNGVVVRIEGSPESPHLYTGDVRPGSRVVLMAESTLGSNVTLTFDNGAAPLAGCGSSFQLGPGGPVEFVVAQGADGEYGFRIDGQGRFVDGCRLVVGTDGELDKTGFVIRESRAALVVTLLSFQRVGNDPSFLDLEVFDSTGGPCRVSVREAGGVPEVLEGSNRLLPVREFGCAASVRLETSASVPGEGQADGKGQTGGTGQVDIVIEPDGGGG